MAVYDSWANTLFPLSKFLFWKRNTAGPINPPEQGQCQTNTQENTIRIVLFEWHSFDKFR